MEIDLTKDNAETLDVVNGCWIGTRLARRLGLNRQFFSNCSVRKPKSLNAGIKIQSTGGLVLVRIPVAISKLLKDDVYVATRIEDGNDTVFDHVFKITNDTSIGLWR